METITRTKIYLVMAGMFLTELAIAGPHRHKYLSRVRFKGLTPPHLSPSFKASLSILQSITGNGALVGQFSSTAVSGSPGSAQSAHWIAANGVSIDTTFVGSLDGHVEMAPCQVVGAQPEDSYAKITQIHTITGGTRRSAGIQGSFTLTKYHDLVLRNGTHGTCGSYSGTITPPGAAH